MRTWHCFVWIVTYLLLMCACEEEAVGPKGSNPRVQSTCLPSGSNVACTVILYDVPSYGSTRDVTAEATWLVSDPSIGEFFVAGFFRPRTRGEVALWSRYDQWEEVEDLHSWFLVDPSASAQRLYFLAGTVIDAITQAPISAVEVRILDGYSRNARAVTNENGYYKVDRILTGEDFSASASKSGYTSVTQAYRVDSPVGPVGNGPFLDFRLHAE